jgi:hypothetical protein
MYRIFPNSDRAIQNEIRLVESDLDKLYNELREEQSIANELKVTLNKLKNKKIQMDPNGMTRQDAIKSTEKKTMLVLRKIKNIQNQITLFEGSKYSMENSQMTTDMKKRISVLHQRMQRVKHINAGELEDDVDDIADINDHIEQINNTVNDTMVSAWTVDMESDEAMLQEFLAESDNEDDIESVKHVAPIIEATPVVQQEPERNIQLPRLSRTPKEKLTPINELF